MSKYSVICPSFLPHTQIQSLAKNTVILLFSSHRLFHIPFVPDAHPIAIHLPLLSSNSLTLKQFHCSPPPPFLYFIRSILLSFHFLLNPFSSLLFVLSIAIHSFFTSICIMRPPMQLLFKGDVTACACFIESYIQTHD
jgi:hypothetical protein